MTPAFSNTRSLDICNDAVFKAIFTKNTAESRTALKSLLSAFIGREIYILKVDTNEPAINDLRDRQIRFDISVRFNDGELADVEMTLNPKQSENLRFEYYTARLFVNQNIRGEGRSYKDLKPAYHISFLGKNLYSDNEWLHRFVYYDPERLIKMGGRTEIVTVELRKLEKIAEKAVTQMNCREGWALFMMYYREDKKSGIIQKIITMDEGIAAADQVIHGFTETELENLAAYSKLKFELDEKEERLERREAIRAQVRAEGLAEGHTEGLAEGLAEGRAQGLAEGRVKGLAEGRFEGRSQGLAEGLTQGRTEAMKDAARKLKAMGIPYEQIIEASGLSNAEIESL